MEYKVTYQGKSKGHAIKYVCHFRFYFFIFFFRNRRLITDILFIIQNISSKNLKMFQISNRLFYIQGFISKLKFNFKKETRKEFLEFYVDGAELQATFAATSDRFYTVELLKPYYL